MPRARRPSPATVERVRRFAGDLGQAATRQMEADHAWYAALDADNRSWVGAVAQAGVRSFVEWFGGDQAPQHVTASVFGAAPSTLTGAISLRQTLDLVRTVVGVVEREVVPLAAPGEAGEVREAILRYTRDVAFAAAEVYAQAAESRGAWDARLESLVVDAVLRGEADDSMRSRAAALGWGTTDRVCVVVGDTPAEGTHLVVDTLHAAARAHGVLVLVAIHGRRVVCIVGDVDDPMPAAQALAPTFGPGPIVVGPRVPHLSAAGRSARAAMSGHAAAPAWPGAPRPVLADDLLAERALLGDQPARSALVTRIVVPLRESSGGTLLETAAAYLDAGGAIEATARALFVHPNTVRYRLTSIATAIGYDLTDPHDAHTVRLALAYGRLEPAVARARRGAP